MSADHPMRVVLYWHMHQPEYRDPETEKFSLPWTYLHTIKDYVDMAAHLEAVPQARAVVNFAPTLLEQIEDYGLRIERFLTRGSALSDPLLSALVASRYPENREYRLKLIDACLRANRERLIERFPAYQQLADIGQWALEHPEAVAYLSTQFFADLSVWYNLAWMGETVRRTDMRIQRLMKQEKDYSKEQRRELLEIIGELIEGVLPRYRALAARGQIELSMTPYAHPIMPLLLDIHSAREAMPDVELPQLGQYPGGLERVNWHLQQGIEVFERVFGFKPAGCWPSEGSISDVSLEVLAKFGFRWIASGGNVLHNSLSAADQKTENGNGIHRPYRFQDTSLGCFFRDDGLSDLIGFTYSNWHADDAIANLVHHIENIKQACTDDPNTVISIILDGENAWEHYPKNGYYFLNTLYKELSTHPDLELTTFSRVLDETHDLQPLPGIVAGSWVYGTFSTWIGDKDKNRAWDMLGDAKVCFDKVVSSGHLDKPVLAAAQRQLAICEGSDWFWWFGEYNSSESVRDFEQLYRRQLSHLYQLLEETPPSYLNKAFTFGKGKGGAMRPGQELG